MRRKEIECPDNNIINENNENNEIEIKETEKKEEIKEDTNCDKPENINEEIQQPLEEMKITDESIDNIEIKEIDTIEETPENKENVNNTEETIEIKVNHDNDNDDNDEQKLIDETSFEIEFENLDIESNSEKDSFLETTNSIDSTENNENNETIIEPKIETNIETTDSPSEKLFQNEDNEDNEFILPSKKSKKRFRLTKKSRMDKIM